MCKIFYIILMCIEIFCLFNVKIFLNIITACPLELVGKCWKLSSLMARLETDTLQRLKCLIIILLKLQLKLKYLKITFSLSPQVRLALLSYSSNNCKNEEGGIRPAPVR